MNAPSFSLPNQDGETVTLESFRGKKLIVYFYPKADTPGCTTQACGLRDNLAPFKQAGVAIVGISPDDVKDLKKFAQKYSLPFTLLADPSTKVIQAYGVWGQKQFMGRSYMGVLRTTFLIDEQGQILKKFDKVNPETHVDLLLGELGLKHATNVTFNTPATGTSGAKSMPKTTKKPAKKVAAKKTVKNTPKKTVKKPAKKVVAKRSIKKTAAKKKK